MIEELNTLKQEIESKVNQTASTKELNDIRVEYLGKKGPIQSLSSKMGSLSIEEKKEFGRSLNMLKTEVNQLLENKKQELEQKELEERLKKETIDITLPSTELTVGGIHPITKIINE